VSVPGDLRLPIEGVGKEVNVKLTKFAKDRVTIISDDKELYFEKKGCRPHWSMFYVHDILDPLGQESKWVDR